MYGDLPCKMAENYIGQNGYASTEKKNAFGERYGYLHRRAYAIHNNYRLQPGDVIRHLCNHRWCVEPTHLVLGTIKSNAKDRSDSVKLEKRLGLKKLSIAGIATIRELIEQGYSDKEIHNLLVIGQ